jgi:hypothetical protein
VSHPVSVFVDTSTSLKVWWLLYLIISFTTFDFTLSDIIVLISAPNLTPESESPSTGITCKSLQRFL